MNRGDQPRAWRALSRRASPMVSLVTCATLLFGCVESQDTVAVMQPATDDARDHVRVAIADELVTVKARDASVATLLDEIKRHSDLVVVSHVPLATRVTLEFERLPMREALELILRDQSFVLQDVQPLAGNGNLNAGHASRLWIFSKGPELELSASHVASANRPEDPDSLDAEGLIGSLRLKLTDSNANVRSDAVSALADVGNDQAAALAIAALNDGDSSVRQEAVYALGVIGGESGIPALQQALIDPEVEVREEAIRAFANIGGDRSAMALAGALNDGDASVRAEAVDALGEIGGETAMHLLRQALADEQRSIGEDAAELLAEAGGS